jgi:uncharacterized membrane protein YhaH (DUF805 family)
MRGRVLEFNPDRSAGLASGDDGKRYRFSGTEWRGAAWPVQGDEVDFLADGDTAREVFPVVAQSEPMRWEWFLFSFEGRITRRDYWLRFALPLFVITLVLDGLASAADFAGLNVISLLINLFLMWPSFAVGAKRCHDRDRSGWFQLILLIPLVGAVWLLIELGFLRGTVGPNRFGPDPLQRVRN